MFNVVSCRRAALRTRSHHSRAQSSPCQYTQPCFQSLRSVCFHRCSPCMIHPLVHPLHLVYLLRTAPAQWGRAVPVRYACDPFQSSLPIKSVRFRSVPFSSAPWRAHPRTFVHRFRTVPRGTRERWSKIKMPFGADICGGGTRHGCVGMTTSVPIYRNRHRHAPHSLPHRSARVGVHPRMAKKRGSRQSHPSHAKSLEPTAAVINNAQAISDAMSASIIPP